jgi:hypothetical protein
MLSIPSESIATPSDKKLELFDPIKNMILFSPQQLLQLAPMYALTFCHLIEFLDPKYSIISEQFTMKSTWGFQHKAPVVVPTQGQMEVFNIKADARVGHFLALLGKSQRFGFKNCN